MTDMRWMVIVFLLGCSSDENAFQWTVIDARTFTLHAPPGWGLIEDQGIDTYVGRITGPSDTIFFDQGYLSFGSLENITEDDESLFYKKLKIDGVSTIIHREKSPDPDKEVLLGIYLDAGDGQHLNRLYVFDPTDESLIVQISLTHRFK